MDASGTQTLKVMVLDLGRGLASGGLLGARGITVLMVRSFPEAVRSLPVMRPHALVVALVQPGPDDVLSLGRLVQAAGSVPVLLVSQAVPDERVVELIKAGIKGYLFASDAANLASRVRELVGGGLPMSEPVSRVVLGRARRASGEWGSAPKPPTVPPPPHSTERPTRSDLRAVRVRSER